MSHLGCSCSTSCGDNTKRTEKTGASHLSVETNLASRRGHREEDGQSEGEVWRDVGMAMNLGWKVGGITGIVGWGQKWGLQVG